MGTGAFRADRELDYHPVIGERWEITKSTEDTSGELFESTVWLDPHVPGPPPHVHPNAEESIEVLQGSLDVFKDGGWTTLRPGETATVGREAPHTFRNPSDETAKIVIRIRPAGRSEMFFRDMQALIAEQKLKGLPPREPGSAIYVAMLFSEYRDWTRPTGPLSAVFKVLAFIGRALRFKL
ncbi:MAG: cupin domain-containing protein [Solirubrobacteraceae bacterium]